MVISAENKWKFEVTSPYEWKILECEVKQKQKNVSIKNKMKEKLKDPTFLTHAAQKGKPQSP